jgi:hypothetical protein
LIADIVLPERPEQSMGTPARSLTLAWWLAMIREGVLLE